jgi:hypothetical protein
MTHHAHPNLNRLRHQGKYKTTCLILCTVLAGCVENDLPRTKDWWISASDRQIAELVYRSYCAPDPTTCLNWSAYKIGITRKPPDYFVIEFKRTINDFDTTFSCSSLMRNQEVDCGGSGRRGGKNCGYIYPIIWEKGQKVAPPREAC